MSKTAHKTTQFNLDVVHNKTFTTIRMQLLGTVVNTKDIASTHSLLQLHLPSVLNSKCFNENNFPFHQEVRQTEIGHLFEHILLEYLCILKIEGGADDSVFNGLTRWDWDRESIGSFHIIVDVGKNDAQLFAHALGKTIDLTSIILQSPFSDRFSFSSPERFTDRTQNSTQLHKI